MDVVMVASECEPYAKTGGLADVVDALARALGRRGHRVEVFLPRYRGTPVPDDGLERLLLNVPVGVPPGARRDVGDVASVDVLSAPGDGYRVRLVDHPGSFDRPGFYGEGGADYADNAGRFALLGRTALETRRAEARAADVLHGHDWQAAPTLLLLHRRYADDPGLAHTATLLTCHNLAYHGWTPRREAWRLDLPPGIGDEEGVDLLRAAVREADLVNTVSPAYAEETRTPEYGAGLDDLLRERGDRYIGILNGLDTELWDPAADPTLAANYSLDDLSGKRSCKADLFARHALSGGPGKGTARWDEHGAPLLGMVGRLDPQKGFDLLTDAAPAILRMGARIIVLGTGDASLIAGLRARATDQPDRLVVIDRFDRDEARRIYAGCDAFLMPSRFEPSGQGQLVALRYGSVPIVRSTGGLADTVFDADADPERGNGFTFGPPRPAAFAASVRRAIAAFRDQPRWAALQGRGMAEDHSWARPAALYEAAYERAIRLREERR